MYSDQPVTIESNDIWIIAKYIYNSYGLYTSSSISGLQFLRLSNMKTYFYPSQVSLETVSTGTGYTWSNILGLEAVLSINIFLHSLKARLHFTWCQIFTEKMWQLFLQKKWKDQYEVLQV